MAFKVGDCSKDANFKKSCGTNVEGSHAHAHTNQCGECRGVL